MTIIIRIRIRQIIRIRIIIIRSFVYYFVFVFVFFNEWMGGWMIGGWVDGLMNEWMSGHLVTFSSKNANPSFTSSSTLRSTPPCGDGCSSPQDQVSTHQLSRVLHHRILCHAEEEQEDRLLQMGRSTSISTSITSTSAATIFYKLST